MWIFIICAFILLVLLFLKDELDPRNKKIPPGPFALPFFGNVLSMEKPYDAIKSWTKIYGPIYRIKMGRELAVVISDYKMIRELFSQRISSGRPKTIFQEYSKGNYGIVNTEKCNPQNPRMPYTEAVIAETLRISKLVPLAAPHRMIEESLFHGYRLPKDCVILPNIKYVHEDPQVWGEDVNEFKPERFLSKDGLHFVENEALLTFSFGYRKCLGYSIATDSVFLLLTRICQQFNILPGSKTTGSEGFYGITHQPNEFNLVFQPRHG